MITALAPLAYSHHHGSGIGGLLDLIIYAVIWSGISHITRSLPIGGTVVLVLLAGLAYLWRHRRRGAHHDRIRQT